MKYQQPTFTLPAASNKVTQEEWDRIFNSHETCCWCGHSLKNNNHGFDQNDARLEGDELKHLGRCTYCKECRRRSK